MQLLSEKKIGIIGGSRGLGGWLARFFAENGYSVCFTSADSQSQLPDNVSLTTSADIIFVAVPIPSMCQVLSEIYPFANGKTIVEVCSVKKFIVEHYQRLCLEHPEVKAEFISLHPMFGPSLRRLRGQVFLFTYLANPRYATQLQALFEAHQARCYQIDYLHHDRVMGVVQGLNHFTVFASAKTLNALSNRLGIIRNIASPPYRIFLIFFSRYVLQDANLYADIQMYNEFVPEVLALFRQEVEKLYQIILRKDKQAFLEYAAEARNYFFENQEDMGISDHLIEQLGAYLSKLSAEKVV